MIFIRKYSHWVTFTFASVLLVCISFNNSYWTSSRVLCWDVYGYSQYLSSAFIYGDIKNPKELDIIDSVYHPAVYGYGRHCVDTQCKSIAFKYTMGNAVMMAPFYLTAHVIAKNTKSFPADGYSQPYQFAVAMSTLFWAIIGLAVLTLLLGLWFSPVVVSITLLLVVLSTNYLYYASLEAGMTHIPSFFCIAFALLSMFHWFDRKSWKYAVLFGLSTGLVALIRLPDLTFGIIPAIFFVKAFLEVSGKDKLKLVLQACTAALFIALVFFPQMAYWKYVSGNWIHYSYVDEKFYFNNPHIMEGLFSYKKGWLLYTPIMVFSLVGIFPLIKRMRWLGIGVLIFIAVNTYVVFSWWMWWYGGSFGARSMIQSYAVLAIPFAFTIERITEGFTLQKKRQRIWAIFFSILLLFFLTLNLFQTFQYKRGIMHYDSMTQKSYWSIFGKYKLSAKEWNDFYTE